MTDTRQRAVGIYQGAFAAFGVGALACAWSLEDAVVPGLPLVLLALAFAVVIGVGDRTELSFRIGGDTLAATSATVPLLVAALYLPPAVAGVAAMLSYLAVELRPGQVRFALYGAGSTAVAIVAASLLARSLVGGAPSPELAILAGAIAAITFEVLYTGAGMGLLELRRRGSAKEFLPDARPIIVFDVLLAIIGIAVVAPFAHTPAALLAVLVAFQWVAHRVLGTLEREQEQRTRATMLQQTFSRYVPGAVVQQLIDSGDDVELGGETRDVTVMFCDIRDFTSWAERHEPADVLADLNQLLGGLAQCVFETEGTLDKFTGDGLMAFWGAPIAQPDHADRAVEAAMRFEASLRTLNGRRELAGDAPFRIGVGIHSGSAIVGNVGHEDRHDYTAIGDTVNVAARLEAASRQLGAPIVLSQQTRELLADARADRIEDAGEITVKGRTAPLAVHVIGRGRGSAAA